MSELAADGFANRPLGKYQMAFEHHEAGLSVRRPA